MNSATSSFIEESGIGQNGFWLGCKNVAGRPFILMGPTNNEAVYLRFIESENLDKNFRSLKTYGWNAIEILVKDTEQLFLKLKDSQYFRIVGEPVYISDEKSIKAMQVLGPSNELIYFTSIEKPEKTGLTIEGASRNRSNLYYDIGVDNIESLRRYYSENSILLPRTQHHLELELYPMNMVCRLKQNTRFQ